MSIIAIGVSLLGLILTIITLLIFRWATCLSVCLSVCLPVCLSVHLLSANGLLTSATPFVENSTLYVLSNGLRVLTNLPLPLPSLSPGN